MHIKEIIIDGFKSYSVKTNINYFDPQFNAITGLNGSGKSNILDAICFVLGISSLSHVRASNLNELIYKYGQAGINKASVTIIFDNSDKRFSPIGCEDYEEIIVTRSIYQSKSKYYLNGYNATQENIKSLFLSVKLNINNPHFLIMQGKVTQVVNMKPLDILGLLEEAAGTSMYEMKKETALKTIKKKENKLEEINKIIKEEITPQLEKLLKDKQNYLTWKSRENEIFRITRLLTALDYHTKTEYISNRGVELSSIRKNIEDLTQEISKKKKNLEKFQIEMESIENVCKKENNQALNDLENNYKSLQGEMKSLKQKEENIRKSNQNSIRDIDKYETEISQGNITTEKLDKIRIDLESSLVLLEKEQELKQNLLSEYERNLENFNLGKLNKDGEIHNINKIISEIKINLNKCTTEKNSLTNQLKFYEEEHTNKKANFSEFKKSTEQLKKQALNLEKNIQILRQDLGIEGDHPGKIGANIISNPQNIEFLKRDLFQLENELQKHEQLQSEFMTRYASRVELNYRDPEQNFDRNRVKGRIIRLFTLENERYATALEQLAGGRLYNIVTDNEKTSGLLLNRKCFDGYNTFIPNNKIMYKEPSSEIKRLIHDIAGDEAKLAIDLIKFDKEILPAMQFVFGTTYVCNSNEIAKKLTFNDRIRARCVNLEGDIFDPNGSVTGGATVKNNDNILVKIKELNLIQANLRELKSKISFKKQEIDKCIESCGKNNQLKAKLENLINERNNISEENILRSVKNYENEITRINEEVKRIEQRIILLAETETNYNKDLIKHQNEMEDLKKNGTSKEIYEKKIKEVRFNLSDLDKNVKNYKKTIIEIEYEINKKKEEISENIDLITNEKESLSNNKQCLVNIEKSIKESDEKFQTIFLEINSKRQEMAKNQKEYEELQKNRQAIEKEIDQITKEVDKKKTKIQKFDKELKDIQDSILLLEKQNPWIEMEKNFFGIKDSDYDFGGFDHDQQFDKLNKLKEENTILKRKVNMKVDVMTDKSEKQYDDLVSRKEILLKDKNLIEKTILELDEKRKSALETIYEHVNKSLNSIYSTILPGTKAKLGLLPGKNLMDGLELKVAFNETWKKSLSELSGGQRSLLALSLILSLLLFKPAPFYILDEIDAALDLSHTANLGVMLKEHFPQSQFIIVSLKDGMFTNANVLYKVSFVDGSSRVERIAKEKR